MFMTHKELRLLSRIDLNIYAPLEAVDAGMGRGQTTGVREAMSSIRSCSPIQPD